MAYTLIWVEVLGVGLLGIGLVLALIARLRMRWLQLLLATLLLLAPTALAALLLAVTAPFKHWLYGYLVCLVIGFVIGTLIIVLIGLLRNGLGEPRARRWPRGRLAVALALAVAVHLTTVWSLDATVSSRLAALRAEAGSMAVTIGPGRVSDRDNAAFMYQKSFEALEVPQDLSEKAANYLEHRAALADNLAGVRKSLEKQQLALSLFRRAAAMPDCRFDRDYARPSMFMLLEEVQQMRGGTVLLALDARVQAADGNVSRAYEDVSAMFGVSRHVAGEVLLISFMVAATVEAKAFETLEAVINSRQPTAQELQALQMDDVISFRTMLQRTFLMEEAFGLAAFSSMTGQEAEGLGLDLPPVPWQLPYTRVLFLPGELKTYRSTMERFRNAMSEPYRRGLWRAHNLDRPSDQIGVLLSILTPSLERLPGLAARADAQHAVALTTVAVARYQADKGHYPKDLGTLFAASPQTAPIDPCDGKPLKMIQREHEIVLYSVGPDGVDNQAAPFDEVNQTGDITLTLRQPTSPTSEPGD